ncbi:MAG: FAD-dependent oxidoreductase [Cyclobacteriaceae bacterium]|nr:FAD-dependent oxidoreductase [Cyclobacteriaceae bacterium]
MRILLCRNSGLILRVILLTLILAGCKKETPSSQVLQTEVLVVGGGASGVSAALQAARSGSQVILVEETPWLGGMLTAAGVSATDGNHRLPSGIWGEFREMLYTYYGGADSVETGWVSNTLFEPHIGNRIWNQLLTAESNIRIINGYRPVSVTKDSEQVTGVWFSNEQSDSLKIAAAITIEATELGDVLALADAPYLAGQDARALTVEEQAPQQATDIIQDLTFAMILQEYPEDQTIEEPPGYDPAEFNCACKELCDDPDFEVVDCATMMQYARLPNNKYMINWPIHGNDYYLNSLEMTPEARAMAYQEAKMQSWRFLYHLQTKGGFSNLGIAQGEFSTEDGLPFIPYHRESRRLQGVDFLTLNHLQNPYAYDLYRDAIAVGDYPLDHHHGKNLSAAKEEFPSIPSFSIPYGCLVPQTIDGLIVAEKSISVSHLANGATRLQPCVILIGQAAGAAAAICINQNLQPRDLDIRILQQQMLDAGCWLMPFIDMVPEDSIFFQAVQKVGLTGLMKGTGVPFKWANQTWFYADSLFYLSDLLNAYQAMDHQEIIKPEVDYHLSRLEFMMLIWGHKGAPKAEASLPFKDLSSDPALIYAFENGWLLPWEGEENFQPYTPITRKEAAFVINKALRPFEQL